MAVELGNTQCHSQIQSSLAMCKMIMISWSWVMHSSTYILLIMSYKSFNIYMLHIKQLTVLSVCILFSQVVGINLKVMLNSPSSVETC